MTEAERSDHEEIRQLLSRYNILGDRGQVDEMLDLFATDAAFSALDRTVVGHEGIAEILRTNPSSPRHTVTRHHLGTQLIQLTGDSANVRTYFSVLTNIGLDHHGAYVDEVVRIKGRWLIGKRDVRLDWQAPNSVYEPLPVHRRAPPSVSRKST